MVPLEEKIDQSIEWLLNETLLFYPDDIDELTCQPAIISDDEGEDETNVNQLKSKLRGDVNQFDGKTIIKDIKQLPEQFEITPPNQNQNRPSIVTDAFLRSSA